MRPAPDPDICRICGTDVRPEDDMCGPCRRDLLAVARAVRRGRPARVPTGWKADRRGIQRPYYD